MQEREALAFPAAQFTRELWEAASSFRLIQEDRDGMKVIRPDYWVVRVSLLDMSDKVTEALVEAITRNCAEQWHR